MKIKNLEIKKGLKNKAIALATSFVLASAPVGSLATKAEANAITQNYLVMNYFTDNIQENIEDYLDKGLSKSNLTKLLGYYDTLYDYIYNGTYVRNTYFVYLDSVDQQQLYYLLIEFGNEIYNKYKSQYYYTTTCKEILGSSLQYNSTYETGYSYDHEKTIVYFKETLDNQLDKILSNDIKQNNLKSALDVYAKLVEFIQGYKRKDGYVFGELTQVEQQDILNLVINWTYDIYETYGHLSYYSSVCTTNGVRWTVNISNLYNELGEYIGNNNEYIPNNPTVPTIPSVPTNPGTQIPTIPSTPITPEIQIPTVPSVPTVPNVGNAAPTVQGNNTIGKDWRSNYIDPSINTSRGERDWTPENIDEFYNTEDDYWRYTQDPRGYYYQNGYYDAYGNYIPYNQNYYEDGYVEDYVPTYIPR